jgi:hypothetical protein
MLALNLSYRFDTERRRKHYRAVDAGLSKRLCEAGVGL